MTVFPLSRLLAIESDHTVCFDRQGREITWPEFVQTVGALAAKLSASKSRFWALNTSNSFEYGCALFACWSAGKTPVLAPEHMLTSSKHGLKFDGVIGSCETGSKPVISFGKLELVEPLTSIIPSTSELVLFTSGSTGQPTQVQRSILNIEAELDVLESLWGETIGDARIYSTVSHRHVYGMLFRLLWPLVTQRAFAVFNFEYPENLFGEVSAGGALVTSPALLKRIGHLKDPVATPWRAIFSSGGMLPAYAAKDATRLLGVCPTEVLGSTETSGVAWRQQLQNGSDELWHSMPEVRVRQDDESFLEVSSPFMGLSNWHRMGDKVRLETNRSFELLGRGDHIVKIEEKRVSLAEIEQRAAELPAVMDAAAVALEDGVRQYVGLVVQLSESGVVELNEQGNKQVNAAIRRSLRRKLDPVAVPKKFRFVDTIPVNAQGKRRQETLQKLFG
jgi:acyl-coenzyme A synthetase/AMP-(fatty) acid ligase